MSGGVNSKAQLESISDAYSKLQTDLSELIQARQKLEQQFQENKIVKQEFSTLEDDAKIYKLIGPALVPQDKFEAETNVEKRIEYIQNEIKRVEGNIEKSQKEMEIKRTELVSLQAGLEKQGQVQA